MDAAAAWRVYPTVLPMADETGRVETTVHDHFPAFFAAEYPGVVRLVRALTGSRPVAEDVAQEAFAAAHDRWDRVAGFDRPDLWVRRVALNRAIGVHRRRRSEARALERLQRAGMPMVVPVAPQEPDARVWAAVQALPRRQRQLVALVYVEDRAIEDAAAILGLSASTARTHLHRARAALAAALGPPTDEERR